MIEAIHGERTPTELRSLGLLPLMSESEAIPFYLESIACFLKAAFFIESHLTSVESCYLKKGKCTARARIQIIQA